MIFGKSCLSNVTSDKTLFSPTFGIKKVVSCDLTFTDFAAQCNQSFLEKNLTNFNQTLKFAPW